MEEAREKHSLKHGLVKQHRAWARLRAHVQMSGEQQSLHRVPSKLRSGPKMAHASSPEKASPFGEIKLIKLDWASEGIHPVLPLLQHRYFLLTLPFSRAAICRGGESWIMAGSRWGTQREEQRCSSRPTSAFLLLGRSVVADAHHLCHATGCGALAGLAHHVGEGELHVLLRCLQPEELSVEEHEGVEKHEG